MSFRGAERNLPELIRAMQGEINDLKKGVGATRQNTIRLGDFVLEAQNDKDVKMTNLTNGSETRVGDQSFQFIGSKEWSYAGVVAPEDNFLAPSWVSPYDITINRVLYTTQTAGTSPYTINTYLDSTTLDTYYFPSGKTFVERRVNWNVRRGIRFYPGMSANATGDATELSVVYWYSGNVEEL